MTNHPLYSLNDSHSDWVNSVVELCADETLVTASKDKTVKIWSTTEASSTRTFDVFKGSVTDVAAIDSSNVIALSGRTVFILSISNNQILTRSGPNCFQQNLWSCAVVSPSAAVVGDSAGNLYKVRWNNGAVKVVKVWSKAHAKIIARMYSLDGDTFATCSGDRTAKLWDSKAFSPNLVFRGNKDALCCVSYDHKYLVTGSKDGTIGVFDVRNGQVIRMIRTHSNWVRCVRVIENANIIVSAGTDRSIALHCSITGKLITQVSTGMIITSLAILNSGRIAAVGGNSFDVKIVELDQLINLFAKNYDPSPIELSFLAAVKQPDLLSTEFIKEHIFPRNIKSASDLYCGHNIVLLAIRCGVIKAADIHKFNGDVWFFEENLYFPASKLTNESPAVLYPVFRHAQDIGIIRDGHGFRREHDNRLDTKNQLESIQQFVGALSIRLANVEHNVARLSTNLNRFDKRIGDVANAVQQNADNFDALFKAIKKKEKYEMYAACVKVMLYLIPLFGKALGEAAYTGAGVLMNLSKHDIAKTAIDLGTALTQKVFNVDLSNAHVTYCALSDSNLRRIDVETQTIMMNMAQRNGFRSMESVRNSLKRTIETIAKQEKFVALLDMGSAKWLNESPLTTSDSLSTSDNNSNQESTVRYQFKAFAKGKRSNELKIVEAVEALNTVFKVIDVPKQITADEFEAVFVEISEELHVNEDDFIKVFHIVRPETRGIDEDRLAQEYAEIFDENMMGRNSAGIEISTRLLRHACKVLKKRGAIGNSSISDTQVTEEKVAMFDRSGYEKITRDDFVDAALYIVHGSFRRKEKRKLASRKKSSSSTPKKQV